MAERNLAAACLAGGIVQSAAAQLGTERAGVFFVADIKHDRADLGGDADVLDAQLVAQRLYRGEVHLIIAHLQCNSHDCKMVRIKAAQLTECYEQRERVLAAGNTDRNPVALIYHMVMVHRTADIGKHFLHNSLLFDRTY